MTDRLGSRVAVATLTPDQIAALPCADPVAHYKGQHVSALCADLGVDCDEASEYAVRGPQATLIMRWYGNQVVHDAGALARVGGVAAAVADAAAALVVGQPVWASREVIEDRIITCTACPTWDPARGRCRACGCLTAAKARLVSSACPLDRWRA